MGVHVLVHRRPDAPVVAKTADLRWASVKIWRLEVRRVALVKIVTTPPLRTWESEETARARRRRHLLADNPTSG